MDCRFAGGAFMVTIKEDELTKFIAENKGKRKFKQSVELAINFKEVDFSKQENRLNLDILLPNGKGKSTKIAVFATERSLIEAVGKAGAEVIDGTQLDSIANDQARLRSLLNFELFAQPSLMPNIAKLLGQFLGPRNKMPKPLLGSMNMQNLAVEANRRITIRNKGKFLPTIHCVIGTEDLEPKKIYENLNEVVNTVSKKVGQNRIRSIYVKMTMSKPVRLM